MRPSEMKLGVRYIVTKPSKNYEFQVGDHLWIYADGAISCSEAGGFMPKEDVAEATEGMLVAVDAAWQAIRREKLQAQIDALDC